MEEIANEEPERDPFASSSTRNKSRAMSQPSTAHLPRVVTKVVVLLMLIGLVGAAHRAYVLLAPPQTPHFTAAELDVGFAAHRLLTFVHIVPASLVIALMPLQFVSRIRERHLAFHRWSGRVVIALGF